MAGGETPPLRVRYLLRIESLLFNIAYRIYKIDSVLFNITLVFNRVPFKLHNMYSIHSVYTNVNSVLMQCKKPGRVALRFFIDASAYFWLQFLG